MFLNTYLKFVYSIKLIKFDKLKIKIMKTIVMFKDAILLQIDVILHLSKGDLITHEDMVYIITDKVYSVAAMQYVFYVEWK